MLLFDLSRYFELPGVKLARVCILSALCVMVNFVLSSQVLSMVP